MEGNDSFLPQNYPPLSVPVQTPPGLTAIYNSCRRLYPDQPNPLQVTALVKYWLGGPDPLDYISMYANPGDPEQDISPHWHYVSFGLSDLYGDGRVHECAGGDGPSGFGFELTFRLRREPGETAPPTWPAALMQALARYVFASENTLCVGDHISWHSPLDSSESRIQHMLMSDDPQLTPITTPYGIVNFVQVIGVCEEELKAAQHWNGPGVLEIIKTIHLAGGPWLLTDMRRGETIFELDPQIQEQVDRGIEEEGSNLSGVTSRCSWEEHETHGEFGDENKENRLALDRGERRNSVDIDKPHLSQHDSEQIKATLQKGLINTKPVLPPIIPNPTDESHPDHPRNRSRKESFDSSVSSEAPTELLRTRSLDTVHLKFNFEAGSLLTLALKGRLKHGRHFTFKSVVNETAVTLVPSSVQGSIVNEEHPYGAHGPWLQVLITNDFIDLILQDITELSDIDNVDLPKTYRWKGKKLSITVLPDEL